MGRENLMFVKRLCQFTEKKSERVQGLYVQNPEQNQLWIATWQFIMHQAEREREREERELQDIQ